MTVAELLSSIPIDRREAEILLAFVLKTDRTWLIAHREQHVPATHARKFHALVQRRKKHEPIAYLTHHKEFYGRPFFVSKHVLIPRPETELTVERVIAIAETNPIIWDVGTGSGAIAVTVAKEIPNAAVLATDVSARALTAAKQNAKRNHASGIAFLKSDLLQPAAYRWLKSHARRTTHHAPSLIIAANLPYLPVSDKKILEPDVVKHEPSSALFSGTDGLTLITKFLGQLSRHLPEWGYRQTTVLLEYDPPQTKKLLALTKKRFPAATVTVHRDLSGRDRLLEIRV